MIKKIIIWIVIVLIIIGLLVYIFSSFSQKQYVNNPTPNENTNVSNNTTATSTTNNIIPIKLVDEPYYKFAYEINPYNLNNLSAVMKQVLSGFIVTSKNNTDGTVTVSFTSTNTEYKNQSYNLKPGQKLYFIEKSLGDDSNGQDAYLLDDSAVIVDSSGNVVQ